jgi:general secretion pathway protein G
MMKKNGFTLIELMAVIVILGILATFVVINVNPFLNRANVEKARADISQIEKAIEMFKFNENVYPSTQQGLESLVTPSSNLKKPYLFPDGGYISTIPLDPWGNSYIYEYPSRKGLKYDIYTLGADGMPGGDGENLDIGNWTK